MIEKRQTQSREYKEILERNRQIRAQLEEKLLLLRENVDDSLNEFDEEEYEFFIKEETIPID